MDDISLFRGMGGEVIRNFLHPVTFITAIPIFAYWSIVWIIIYLIGQHMHPLLEGTLILFAASVLMGRFAIPASQGELDCGFFSRKLKSGDTIGFAIRYCTLTLFWLIPCGIILLYGLNGSVSMAKNQLAVFTESQVLSGQIIGFLFLDIIALAAPLICCIIATYTESLGEIFSTEPFDWLLGERSEDFLTFFALFTGALLLFYLIYLIPMILLGFIAMKLSISFGLKLFAVFKLLPFILSPVLLGRLSGSFITGGATLDELQESAANATNETESKALSEGHVTQNPVNNKKPTLEVVKEEQTHNATIEKKVHDILKQQETLPAEDFIKMANEMLKQVSDVERDQGALLLRACLLFHQNKKEEALKETSKAIAVSIKQGCYLEAGLIFKAFKKDKNKIDISIPNLKTLSTATANLNEFTEATWLMHQHIIKTEDYDDPTNQKQLLGIASQAEKAEDYTQAFAVYNFFISNFPKSTFLDFAQERVQAIKSKIEH